ncbi:MAG: tetratricopeptide repeat protein [Myxococcales bacterium]|nr:tetratricopeptide repeat protein [Myxococcales bacterium]MDD9966209.1 tetratricopeptide repeat protein [Myxococcales bacterium]
MSDDNIIHVRFGPFGGRTQRRVSPDAEPPPSAEPRGRDPLGDLYSTADVAQLFGLSAGKLRYWERSDFIERSGRSGRHRYYTFQDLISIRAAKALLDAGVTLRVVRRSVAALSESLPRVARPLSSLRIMADGMGLVVRDQQGAYDPVTGQQRLDFDVSSLRDDVVRVLGRSGQTNDYRRAYEAYLEGCRLDEDEATFEAAEQAYRRALELDPTLANALTNLGNLLFRRGDTDEAEGLYIRALRVDPEQPEAFYNLGFLLYERGDFEAAALNFKRAVASDPSFADAHFNLGMVLTDLGRADQAREHFRTYLELDPESTWSEIARRHLRR